MYQAQIKSQFTYLDNASIFALNQIIKESVNAEKNRALRLLNNVLYELINNEKNNIQLSNHDSYTLIQDTIGVKLDLRTSQISALNLFVTDLVNEENTRCRKLISATIENIG